MRCAPSFLPEACHYAANDFGNMIPMSAFPSSSNLQSTSRPSVKWWHNCSDVSLHEPLTSEWAQAIAAMIASVPPSHDVPRSVRTPFEIPRFHRPNVMQAFNLQFCFDQGIRIRFENFYVLCSLTGPFHCHLFVDFPEFASMSYEGIWSHIMKKVICRTVLLDSWRLVLWYPCRLNGTP